jgi:outer membrane protein
MATAVESWRVRCATWVVPATICTLAWVGAPDLGAKTPTPASPGETVALAAPPPVRGQSPAGLPGELLRPGATVTLAEVVDIALANSPLTRATYRQARSEAANVRSQRGAYLPTLDASAAFSRVKQPTAQGQNSTPLSAYGPALSLSYLLFDFGGREAKVAEARQALLAADWRHNAMIHDVVLAVQQAYFQYLSTKALLDAAHATLTQAQASLDAANGRHDAGVATIADVLQARTALAQARLGVDTLEGQVLAARGALATAMGLPAYVPFDVGGLPAELPLDRARPAVDDLIAAGRLSRPDFAAQRALAQKAAAHVGVVRAEGLPSLSLQGSAGRNYYGGGAPDTHQDNWVARVQLSVPLFHGFSHTNDLRGAREDEAAAWAQAASYEQQVVLEVWTSYYALEAATQRVRTSGALLASATQSEQVALARYKEGVGTVLELLTAQAALGSARALEIQARSDWYVAVARLAHDSGALVPSEGSAIVTEEKSER